MWLKKYPDGGKVEKPKPKFSIKNDPLRPQGLGVQTQDNLHPLPLVDVKAISDYNTDEAKVERNLVRLKQQAVTNNKSKAELNRRRTLIEKSNTEGGFKNSAVAEKMRVFPESVGGWGEVFDDYINLPRVLIGNSADALGHAKTAKEYAAAIATPIAIGATGYSPLSTVENIATSPVANTLASIPGKIYNSVTNNNLKQFNALQEAAPIINDNTYNTLRNINKAGNIYKNETIPLDQRINKLISLDIPEENIVRMTGKTRQELLQDAHEFQNIKKAREENPGLDSRDYGSINLTRPNRQLPGEDLSFTSAEMNAAMRFNLDRAQSGLSTEEIMRRIQTNANPHVQYGEFNLDEILYGGQRSTPQMAQMQKANNISDRVDKFTNKLSERKFSKQYIPSYDETQTVKNLIPSITRNMDSRAEQTIMKKVSEVSKGNSGDLFRGASSLSDGSFPSYMKNIEREVQNKMGEPLYGGHSQLNNMGFLTNAGVPKSDVTGYLNKYIVDFNKATGKNIPKAYLKGENIMYPDVVFKKFEQGGTIKNWLNKY